MRKLMIAAGLLAGLGLTACSQETNTTAETAAAPAAKEEFGRPAPHYAGQDRIQSINTATIEAAPGGGVVMSVEGEVDGPGYTQVGFLPYVVPATPPDGIYNVEVVAQAPATPGAAAPTPVSIKSPWDKYTDGRVKGVRFLSKTNEVVAMLPASGGAPAAK